MKKKQFWRYVLLRFVAEERILNSHCLVTHSYLYSLTRVQQNTFFIHFYIHEVANRSPLIISVIQPAE